MLRCTALSLTLGTCLPGEYTLQYTATSPAGVSVSSFLLVLVEMRVSTSLAFTFAPNDRCVETSGFVYIFLSEWWQHFHEIMTWDRKGVFMSIESAYPPFHDICSWNNTFVSHFSDQLQSNASAATAMAIQLLPEFGINVSSIRSVSSSQIRYHESVWSVNKLMCIWILFIISVLRV